MCGSMGGVGVGVRKLGGGLQYIPVKPWPLDQSSSRQWGGAGVEGSQGVSRRDCMGKTWGPVGPINPAFLQ